MDLEEFKNSKEKYNNAIDKAVSRRHKIVHEADMSHNEKNDNERLTSIKSNDVLQWKEAYQKLVEIIDKQVETWEEKQTDKQLLCNQRQRRI